MTSDEWEEAAGMRDRYADAGPVAEAGWSRSYSPTWMHPGRYGCGNTRRVGEQVPPENPSSMIDDLRELLPARPGSANDQDTSAGG